MLENSENVDRTAPATAERAFGPWNPGLESQVPERLMHLCTLCRPENVFTSLATARELRDLTGLPYSEVIAFRPGRLALHELMIRVSADFSVPDGSRVEDLGINFRDMVRTLLADIIEPRTQQIAATYAAVRTQLSKYIDDELDRILPRAPASNQATAPKPSGLRKWFMRAQPSDTAPARMSETEVIASWSARAHHEENALIRVACRALARVVGALHVRHGHVWGGRDLVSALVTDVACNELASEEIGRLIAPWLREAAATHHYQLLPRQDHPVVMNTKGASASGKSTIRPMQKRLAGEIGVCWSEFALISPDIWRKQLIDYASLGTAYKYGGALSGDELAIIDGKLDRYMAAKAQRGEMTHLLIDRFRFDSFAADSEEAGSNLLTRFGQIVYLFFMITPPASLVERAWNRGLEVGRYKAVDDTLAHAVAAYSGMPQLFFTWIERSDKRVHFEFLDNSVSNGERPLTAAFGSNALLNVLDVRRLIEVRRYQRIDVQARAPEELFPDRSELAPEHNTRFLRDCVARFAEVNFADQRSGRIYLRLERGRPVWVDGEALAQAAQEADTRAGV
ncbi:MAG TPA: hypothetical protein VMV45_03995, partial [Casimicrobiaceae bacterium]|nr:hypothetical protein [Casimicrobiaceae bacterium]